MRVKHFESLDGVDLAAQVQNFLWPSDRYEVVSLSYARTDPPNDVKAALLVYREVERPLRGWLGRSDPKADPKATGSEG